MAYTKNQWNTGDVITSTKLSHMEDGIYAANQGGGGGGSDLPPYDENNIRQFLGIMGSGSQSTRPSMGWQDLRAIFPNAGAGKSLSMGADGSINWSEVQFHCDVYYDSGERHFTGYATPEDITETGIFILKAEVNPDASSESERFRVYWGSY